MDERFTQLEKIAFEARAKKGRMDTASRENASALIVSILADATVDPSPSLQLLEDIKAEAIAEAIRSCWPKMDATRRNVFRRWVPSPTTERSYRRLAFLAASIIESDGATALEWLGLLIPRGRKTLGKESRETLASVLFGDRVFSFDALVGAPGNVPELLRICTALFDIVADPTMAVSASKRARLASAVLDYLGRPDAPKDGLAIAELKSKIFADAKKWPAALRDQFIPDVEQGSTAPLAPPLVETVAAAQHRREPVQAAGEPTTPTGPVAVGPLQKELPRLEGELSNRISGMTREVDLLRRAHECLSQLVLAAEHVEEEREAARRDLERLQESLQLVQGERTTAKADAARAIQRASELAASMEQVKADAESERKRLAQQISANASGRLEEFKKRLGLNLSRLVVDLPSRDTPVTAELGKILLLQFHQFLDALRQEGIETRIGA